ncbi:MAG: flagellar basal body L-ring protein FlgH, partial [Thermoguttaceae bacterium]
GQRRTKIGEETKVMYFSGEVRQEDISVKDNTISSDKVYSLYIDDTPGGNVYDSIRRGWGTKALDQYGPM